MERVAECVTCGAELRPERAEKYDYCMDPECQAKNARGLTIAAVGVNKAADQYVVLNERTKEEMASGRYRDTRRASSPIQQRPRPRGARTAPTHETHRADTAGAVSPLVEQPPEAWTKSQQDLAFALHVMGRKSLLEISERLGLRPETVAEMIVAAQRRS